MAQRSFDSVTRFAVLTVPSRSVSSVSSVRGEAYADEGTLIMEPVAPPSVRPRFETLPPPPPPPPRPSMPSWDDRVWAVPVTDRTGVTSPTSTTKRTVKPRMSPGDRSASAMLLIASAAMIAALASIGFMHRGGPSAANASVTPTTTPANARPVTVAAAVAPPIAPPVAPPVAMDLDDVAPAETKSVEAKPAEPKTAEIKVASRPVAATAPADAVAPQAPAPQAKQPAAKTAAPASTQQPQPQQQQQQKKALEDLLERLGEEQLKR